jgi:16S rRNA processing protein RimM
METPAQSKAASNHRVIIGKICGIYGVAGWLKVISYTRPRENIFNYHKLMVGQQGNWIEVTLQEGRQQGKGLIVKFEHLSDRDIARQYMDKDIAVNRDELPELPKGEYYWFDLVGLTVMNLEGQELGKVSEIQETGANDVLVVEGTQRQLIPLVFDIYIKKVDLGNSSIIVDWNGEYQ